MKAVWKWIPLVALAAAAFVILLALADMRAGMPSGDAYDYQYLAQALAHLDYPSWAKRAPLYPFLIMLGLPFFEGMRWATMINIISGAGSVLLLFLIANAQGLNKKICQLSAFLLLVQNYFLYHFTRPMADGFFTFMALLSIYLFYKARNAKMQVLFGLVLGLTCITKLEGVLLAVVLLGFLFYSGGLKTLKHSLVPFALVALPWFLRNFLLTGNPAHLYWKGGVDTAGSLSELSGNIRAIADLLSALWIPQGNIKFIAENITYWVGNFKNAIYAFLSLFTVILMFTGFLRYRKLAGGKASPIYLFTIFYIILVTWYCPQSRHLVQIVPILSLFLSIGFVSLTNRVYGKYQNGFVVMRIARHVLVTAAVTVTAAVISWVSLGCTLDNIRVSNTIDSHKKFGEIKPFFQAAQYLARNTDGKVAARQGGPVLGYYLGYERTVICCVNGKEYTYDEQLSLINKHRIGYLVNLPIGAGKFTVVYEPKYKNLFKLVKRFEGNPPQGRDSRNIAWAEIYQVMPASR